MERAAAAAPHVRDLTRDRMAIVISHRFSTVRIADHIVVLDQGKIVEEGDHEALGWANLLSRVFAVDVTVCSKCGGRMKVPAPGRHRNPVLLDSWGCSRKRAPRGRARLRVQPSTSRREARQGR